MTTFTEKYEITYAQKREFAAVRNSYNNIQALIDAKVPTGTPLFKLKEDDTKKAEKLFGNNLDQQTKDHLLEYYFLHEYNDRELVSFVNVPKLLLEMGANPNPQTKRIGNYGYSISDDALVGSNPICQVFARAKEQYLYHPLAFQAITLHFTGLIEPLRTEPEARHYRQVFSASETELYQRSSVFIAKMNLLLENGLDMKSSDRFHKILTSQAAGYADMNINDPHYKAPRVYFETGTDILASFIERGAPISDSSFYAHPYAYMEAMGKIGGRKAVRELSNQGNTPDAFRNIAKDYRI